MIGSLEYKGKPAHISKFQQEDIVPMRTTPDGYKQPCLEHYADSYSLSERAGYSVRNYLKAFGEDI